jgi:hypothetical protein
MLSLCGTILFFSAVCACLWHVLSLCGLPSSLCALLCGLCELTGGLRLLSPTTPLSFASVGFLCGFGGLCVALQVRSATGGALSLRSYFLHKLLQGFFCGVICLVAAPLFF